MRAGRHSASQQLGRYAHGDAARPYLIDREGDWRDLSYVLLDITPEFLQPVEIDILLAIEPETLPLVEAGRQALQPVAGLGRIHADFDSAPLTLTPPGSPIGDAAGFRVGLAAIVGGPGPWSGALTTATVTPGDGAVALGRRVWVADRALAGHRSTCDIRIDGGPPVACRIGKDALRAALAQARTAQIGDVVLATTPFPVPAGAQEVSVAFRHMDPHVRRIAPASGG